MTDTDKMCTEPYVNLHRSLSLSSMNTSTQFFTSHFFISVSVSVSVAVSGKVRAYSHQAKAGAKAKTIKEQVKKIKENFHFRSV